MSLLRLGLTNYRCFAGTLDVELRPVTVVLGRNNSGKSALVRAPLVLSTGVGPDSPAPLDLDTLSEDIVDSFTDLIYGGRPHGGIGVNMTLAADNSPPFTVSATIRNISEYRMQIVERFAAESGEGSISIRWEPDDMPEGVHRYTVDAGGRSFQRAPVAFRGFLPTSSSEGLDRLAAVSQLVTSAFGKVRYLGPFRERPSRLYRVPARMPSSVGFSGEHTAGILASDSARGQRALLREINEGLGESLPGWSVDVVERGGVVSIMLKSRDDETLMVNLADTGTGVAQALPIFVQRALDRVRPPSGPVLEIVEQPELHLHPYAHAALADLYLNAARDPNVRFLIETHSETLLLRLRRRVAEGRADPADIAIYFVDNQAGTSTARRIVLDADGNLDYWPEDVFSEDYQETKALAQAQLDRVLPDAR